MNFLKRFFCLVLISFFVIPVFSEESEEEDFLNRTGNSKTIFNFFDTGDVFRLSLAKDAVLLGSGVVLSSADLIIDETFKVNRKKYDGTIYEKDNVNSFDRQFMHSYSKTLDKTADFVLLAALSTPAALAMTEKEEWITCGVMYAEALLISNGIKELTKLVVNRARPYMYYDSETFPEEDLEDGDWRNSFPSGHSTMAFTGAAFTSYTFWNYFPDSKLRIPVVVGSYTLACSVAALRVMSGNHFMTDVLTGAAIGTAVGILVPALHKFNANNDLNVGLLTNGVFVSVKY